MKKIIYKKKAIKFLAKQDKPTQKRIKNAIENLPNGDVKKMKGVDFYRLRVGNIRVIYNQDGIIFSIFDIGYRGDVYKNRRK